MPSKTKPIRSRQKRRSKRRKFHAAPHLVYLLPHLKPRKIELYIDGEIVRLRKSQLSSLVRDGFQIMVASPRLH